MKIILTFLSIVYSIYFLPQPKTVLYSTTATKGQSLMSHPLSFVAGPDSSIINKYAAVTQICDNGTFIVDNPFEFRAGDKILIYQTQGAVIDTSDSPEFGKILDYAQAGNYEFNYIASINGSTIRLRNSLLRGYDVKGKIQIVSVPIYGDIVLKNTKCKDWDGSTGGILVFEAENLTLGGNIDVSGKGFRGGEVFSTGIPCGVRGFRYPEKSPNGAYKGEGIAITSASYAFGRGAIANGGGGGNSINAGGAGGSNVATGGAGGNQVTGCTNLNLTGGIGGRSLTYAANINKIFMGGGGGSGHSDNNNATAGGNGGGIIIITARKISGNRQSIKSNGISAKNGNAATFTDGQGGGGGAGTILLNTPQDSISVSIELKGGDGGTVLSSSYDLHGPGGGGSGGALLLQQFSALNFTSLNLLGGKNGFYVNANTPHGAKSGENGQTISGFSVAQSSLTYKPLRIDSIKRTPLCNGKESIQLLVSGSQPPFEYSINNGVNWQIDNTFKELTAGTYNIKIRKNDCIAKDTSIRLTPTRSDTMRRDSTVCYPSVSATYRYVYKKVSGCDSVIIVTTQVSKGDTIRLNATTCDRTKAGTDTLRLKNRLGCDSLIVTTSIYRGSDTTLYLTLCKGESSGQRAYTQTGIYKEVLKNQWRCDSTITLNITIIDTSVTYIEHIICKGDSVQIGNRFYKSPITLTDTMQNINRCDSVIITKVSYDNRCKNCEPFIPNAFSPNNDGNNDIFEIYNNNSIISEISIFTRWGNLVYHEKSETPKWDGSWNGQMMPEGIYIYFVRALCKNGKEVVWKGDIALMR